MLSVRGAQISVLLLYKSEIKTRINNDTYKRTIIIIIIYYIYIALNTMFLSALQINVLLPRLCQCFPHIEVHMANKE